MRGRVIVTVFGLLAAPAWVTVPGTGNAYSPPVAATTDSIIAVRLSDGTIVAHVQGTSNDAFSTGTNGSVGPDFDFGASPNLISVAGKPMVGKGQKAGAYWIAPLSLNPTQAKSVQLGPGTPLGGILGSTAYDGQRICGPISVPGYVWSLGFVGDQPVPHWISPGAADPVHFSPVATSQGLSTR